MLSYRLLYLEISTLETFARLPAGRQVGGALFALAVASCNLTLE
jgi:hypothetical protein